MGKIQDGEKRRVERALKIILGCQAILSVALAAFMAAKSPVNVHPDEDDHVAAGRYFETHWLLPPVGSPQTRGTYTKWGFSYLDQGEVVYLIFGKAAALAGGVGIAPAAAMRLVQAALYAVLVSLCLVGAGAPAPAAAFVVLTPQVWYIFSYVNGDAFPFLLLTALVLALSRRDSDLRTYWRARSARPGAGVFAAGGLFGLLLVSKLNYLVACAFVAWAAWRLRREIANAERFALPALLAAAIAVPWLAHHAWINDFQTGTRMERYAEEIADADYKPSGRDPKSFSYIAMRSRGVSLLDIFAKHDWASLTFRSFNGYYGWMSIPTDAWLYLYFGLLDAALVFFLALASDRRSGLLIGCFAFAALVIAQSIYRSWAINFQAQGRYCFPMLPMLLYYWLEVEETTASLGALTAAVGLGFLSLASFLWYAVPRLA